MSTPSRRHLAAALVLASLGAAAATIAIRRGRPNTPRARNEPIVEWRPIPNFKP
jgi:hypothetical protein